MRASALSQGHERALLASLEAAEASFERCHLVQGINQLRAFQFKVLVILGQSDPRLARTLIHGVNEIIEVLINSDENGLRSHLREHLRIADLGNGRVGMEFAGVAGRSYIVEASISLLNESGVGTFHGLDFQVNDAANGARQGIRNWADPTNAGYLSTSHWGVGRLLEADKTVPKLQLPLFIHLTATDSDGYHGLTAEIAGVKATDAFDDPSWLTITSNAPAVLRIGKNLVTWTVTDLSGNTSTRKQLIFVHARVPTALKYIGSRLVVVNTRSKWNSFTPGAMLLSPSRACVAGQQVRFTLDRDPLTGEAVTTELGTAKTNLGGLALLKVSSNKWKAGTYTLTVTYEGNDLGCVGSSTSVTLTVVVRP